MLGPAEWFYGKAPPPGAEPETRVEISHDVSERFAAAVREPDTKDCHIHIEPLEAVAN